MSHHATATEDRFLGDIHLTIELPAGLPKASIEVNFFPQTEQEANDIIAALGGPSFFEDASPTDVAIKHEDPYHHTGPARLKVAVFEPKEQRPAVGSPWMRDVIEEQSAQRAEAA